MLIHDRFVFLHLQKTGGTHIANLLATSLGGKHGAKHERPDFDLEGRPVLASIRDPWSWYVSLWAYGCSGRGGLHQRLITKPHLRQIYRHWKKRQFGKPMSFLAESINEVTRRTGPWKALFADAHDPELFRRWLKKIHHRRDWPALSENYSASDICKLSGFYSYRYLNLFLVDNSLLFSRSIKSFDQLLEFCRRKSQVDHFIRCENLETDLRHALAALGIDMDEEMQEVFHQPGRRNASSHRETWWYYDEETYELVRDRERLIVDLHGYEKIGTDLRRALGGAIKA